jgi:lysophospholipase L1-like esterase
MKPLRLVALLLLVVPGLARAECKFYLKDGDRVVFYGDSITEQRQYTAFVETFAVTRFPKRDFTFVHSGWGGDRVTGGGGGPIDVRLKRDVVAYKPTVVTIMLGMNDGSYVPFEGRIFDTYSKGMENIVAKLKSEVPNVRITLIQPSPYDDVTRKPNFEGGYNAVLVRYGDFLKGLALKEHVDIADLNTSVVDATRRANESDPEHAKQLNGDRVHPGPGGQLLMAAALLRAWNAPPVVSKVRIHAEGNGEPKFEVEKTLVSGLTRENDGLTWTQNDESLPFPINLADPVVALAVRSSDVVNKLDQEMLSVDGLSGSDYTLKIDGQDVGQFSKQQLADGVNLAVLSTPMSKQAAEVHEATRKHNDLHYVRWRNVQVPMEGEDQAQVAKVLEGLDALEAAAVKHQRELAQPKPHKYELRPKS